MSTAEIDVTAGQAATEKLTVAQAVRDAMRDEMTRDESVLVLGEDVGIDGGVFRATDGPECGRWRKFSSWALSTRPLTSSSVMPRGCVIGRGVG